jgi:acetyltransferase-like isoleucine patch superfamily enzyme
MSENDVESDLRKVNRVKLGNDVTVMPFVNLYGCEIGDNSFIGPFVEIQSGVIIGKNVRVQSHSFICTGVTIEDDVFIGHGVMFVNDLYPPQFEDKFWKKTVIKRWSSIGNNSTILPVEIGEKAIVGAGSTVTKNVPPNSIVAGNPAKVLRFRE